MNHDSIKNIALTVIKRKAMDVNEWENTTVSILDFPTQFERLDSELPVLRFLITDSDWTIITTRRIIGKISGKFKQIDFNELDDVVYGDYKATKRRTTIFRTTDFYGENLDFSMETGKPSTGIIYSIDTIHQLYKSNSYNES